MEYRRTKAAKTGQWGDVRTTRRTYSLQQQWNILEEAKALSLDLLEDDDEEMKVLLRRFAKRKNLNLVQLRRFKTKVDLAFGRPEKPTTKELLAIAPNSGRKPWAVCPEVKEAFKVFVEAMRGVRRSLDLGTDSAPEQDPERVCITYEDLVDVVFMHHQEEYEGFSYTEVEEDGWTVVSHTVIPEKDGYRVWYHRVRRWCIRENIVIRKVNRLVQQDPQELATRVQECLDAVDKIVGEGVIDRSAMCNLDETSVRIFALLVTTLHYRGATSVRVSGSINNKLTLSMPVVWYGDGTFDYVVVFRSDAKKAPRWECRHGIMWFRANSKWSTKKTYYQIVRYLVPLGRKVKLFMDDAAPGHKGMCPFYFLDSMGVVHLRIPGGTTSVLQAADRPTTNFRLKALLRKHMRRHRIKAVLKGEFGKDPTGLTVAAREKISVILSAVRDEWRATPDYSEGIKRAFDETVLCRQPGNTPNKALGKLLGMEPKEAEPQADSERTECDQRCGESWAKPSAKGYQRHNQECWFTRKALMSPLLEPTLSGALATSTPGLEATAHFQDGSVRLVRILEGGACVAVAKAGALETLDGEWWNSCTRIEYRRASGRLLVAPPAKRRRVEL